MSRTGDPIAQDCFKLLATLLRESDSYKPSNAQLRFLLTWAFSDMEEAANRQAAFGLLKVSLVVRIYPFVGQPLVCLPSHLPHCCSFNPAAPVKQLYARKQ